MYLPWVLSPAAISDIEKRRSRETGGSEAAIPWSECRLDDLEGAPHPRELA